MQHKYEYWKEVNGEQKIKNLPQKIYLQLGEEVTEDFDFKELSLENVCWHYDRVFNNDIEYVLAQEQKPSVPNADKEEDAKIKKAIAWCDERLNIYTVKTMNDNWWYMTGAKDMLKEVKKYLQSI